MFKVYGVTDEEENTSSSGMQIRSLDENQEKNNSINVELSDEEDHDTDVGQIAVDILDTGENIIIVAPIAGVDPSDVDISLSRNILTISGNRNEPKVYNEVKRMLVEECFYGAFSRSVILPENLGFDKISATVEHNVVRIKIPKLKLISQSIKIDKNSQ